MTTVFWAVESARLIPHLLYSDDQHALYLRLSYPAQSPGLLPAFCSLLQHRPDCGRERAKRKQICLHWPEAGFASFCHVHAYVLYSCNTTGTLLCSLCVCAGSCRDSSKLLLDYTHQPTVPLPSCNAGFRAILRDPGRRALRYSSLRAPNHSCPGSSCASIMPSHRCGREQKACLRCSRHPAVRSIPTSSRNAIHILHGRGMIFQVSTATTISWTTALDQVEGFEYDFPTRRRGVATSWQRRAEGLFDQS
ncbi:hypothetical protein BJ166DRAFT_302870 [Pestalotiopsis sp. NC0098]|nr:hypothetical protein BJ166DRAFT_302870 [Pestalotiopsis sp. NC0098]